MPDSDPPQKAVNSETVAIVEIMHDREGVELHAPALQGLKAAKRLCVACAPVGITPQRVVKPRGPVERDSNEKPVLCEKPRPLRVEKRAIGLQRVHDANSRGPKALLKRKRVVEKVESRQQRLATLPAEIHFGKIRLRRQRVANERFEHFATHALRRTDSRASQVIAIAAFKIARRGDRLRHDVERAGSVLP